MQTRTFRVHSSICCVRAGMMSEAEARIVLTLDKDFWQIGAQRRVPLKQSGVVLFRVHPATSENLEPLVRMFVEANKAWARHVSIVDASGVQMLSAGQR
ncbi:MAG: DUF5615 family PIN-like protein [Acidobacteriota bacterium]